MIRFRTEDCIDLPPRRFILRHVEMNAEQMSVYEDMENMLFAEFEGQPITARVAAVKLLKLREVTGGFIITDQGKEVPLGKDSPKMVELDDLLEQSIADKLGDSGPPSKAIVWAQYQWECKTLIKRYERRYGAKGLFGGISSGAKDAAIRAFKTDPRCRLLVCHPGSAGHGLTLIEANYIFYYSMSYNFEEFYQSYRRTARQGQTRGMTYYFLVIPDTIDEDLLEAIREKKNLSDLITDGKFSREDLIGKRGDHPANLNLNWEMPNASDLPERGPAGENPPNPA
jgi:SNF2 family DNA or RNA helicase